MKLLSLAGAVLLAAAASLAHAKNEPLEPTPPDDEAAAAVVTEPAADEPTKDVFTRVAPTGAVVADIVARFQALYADEMARSSLRVNVSSVVKAERTGVRGAMVEKEADMGGLGIDFLEEAQTQQYRLFLLLKYQFDSTMLGHNRPYVTVMRLTMNCYNVSSDALEAAADAADADEDQAAYDAAPPAPAVRLACDVLEHLDMPRRNESTASIPAYIQRLIFHSAPPAYVHNHSLHVFYDAVEAQDLAFDADGHAVADRDTMHYVRFRVQGGAATDCVVAVEHTNGINTLRYQDSVCYEKADADAAIAAAAGGGVFSGGSTAPAFVLIAALAGAGVAVLLIWRQRKRHRSGYSYVSSSTSKLSHVPGQTPASTPATATTTDAAVAC